MKTSSRSAIGAIRALPVVGLFGLLCVVSGLPVTALAVSSRLLVGITNPTPAAFDYFGNSVAAVGGGKMVIGSPSDDVGSFVNAGNAYIYGTNGVLLVTITNPAPSYNAWFANSVAAIGSNRVIVGAHRNDSGATDAGAAYIYSDSGVLWTSMTNPAPEANDYFGYSVAGVGTNKLVVGVPFDDAGVPDVGGAYCFDVNGVLLATITNPAPAANDYFGNCVAGVGKDEIAVGAYGADWGASNAGVVYVFNTSGALLATITNPAPAIDDSFGYSVAGVGTNLIAVGAFQDDASAVNAGIAYIFDLSGNLKATLANPDPGVGDWFGFSVAAVGSNRVIVGAPLDDTDAADAGSAYVFDTDGALLATNRNPTPSIGDAFGYSVAGSSSNRVIVGSSFADSGAQDAGFVYFFGINRSILPDLTDYDGDGKTDLAVYYGLLGNWYILQSASTTLHQQNFGWSETIPLPADYDGDTIADFACAFPGSTTGTWYILQSSDSLFGQVSWGPSNSIPVPGDYDGDGEVDIAVYEPETAVWYILQSSDGELRQEQWGWSPVIPTPGDYDGDGLTDIAVYDPGEDLWYILQSADGTLREQQWGYNDTVPVPGDYDGDESTDIAVYEPITATWYVQRSSDGTLGSEQWGWDAVKPVAADYDGDGASDITVYFPDAGMWYILQSSNGQLRQVQWGWEESLPINSQYLINRNYTNAP